MYSARSPLAARLVLGCAVLACVSVRAVAASQDPDAARRAALDRAVRELDIAAPPPSSAPSPSSPVPAAPRLLDVSLVVDGAAGGSSAGDPELRQLQGGGHDPRQRGFTLQAAELGLAGVVDEHLRADARIAAQIDAGTGESIVELEEAYLTTLQLPGDLQLKAGQFLTRFGRTNPQHPHAWDWLDQPIENTRVLGGDGMRAPGAQLAWILPTDRYAELFVAAQNATGETMRSFLASDAVYAEQPVGGRAFAPAPVRGLSDLVWSMRLEASPLSLDGGDLLLGASCALGPNATGPDGRTVLYGVDFVWRWRPEDAEHGWPFVKVEGELLGRSFRADQQVDASVPATPVTLPGTTLADAGGFLQGLWGFHRGWAAGLRAEYAGGSGASYDAASQGFARDGDPLRADRWRLSPLLAYHPSEFSRLRLQYDFDDSDASPAPRHTVWLGFEILIGAHPPHAY